MQLYHFIHTPPPTHPPLVSLQLRVPVLLVYGLLAAGGVLGLKGVCVLLAHLGLSFTVAQLRRPALCWACSLLSLSTLHIPSLLKIQVDRSSYSVYLIEYIYMHIRHNTPLELYRTLLVTLSYYYYYYYYYCCFYCFLVMSTMF